MEKPAEKQVQARPLDTTQLLVAGFSLVEKLISYFLMAMLERSRAKTQRAEDRAAVAETELRIAKDAEAARNLAVQKDPADVVREFLDRG